MMQKQPDHAKVPPIESIVRPEVKCGEMFARLDTVRCDMRAGHKGQHRLHGPDGKQIQAWTHGWGEPGPVSR